MDAEQIMDSMDSVLPHTSPPSTFAEITLGILIRGVPSGLLFRGTWKGQPVSVKVGPPPLPPPSGGGRHIS